MMGAKKKIPETVEAVQAALAKSGDRIPNGARGTVHRVSPDRWVFVTTAGVPFVLGHGGLPEKLAGCVAGWNTYARAAVEALDAAGKIPQEAAEAWLDWFYSEQEAQRRDEEEARLRELAARLGYTLTRRRTAVDKGR